MSLQVDLIILSISNKGKFPVAIELSGKYVTKLNGEEVYYIPKFKNYKVIVRQHNGFINVSRKCLEYILKEGLSISSEIN